MKKETLWGSLYLFGEEITDGTEAPAPIPQATQAEAEGPPAETGEAKAEGIPAAGESEANGSETRREAFRALMEGEYKDLFTAYFQETFNRRFKEQKETKEELERARAELERVSAFFGTDRAGLAAAMAAAREQQNTAPTREEIAQEVQRRVTDAVAAARLETESQLLAHIRARGLRPAESALSDGTGNALRGGASHLSRAQRAELARRAANGERIKL